MTLFLGSVAVFGRVFLQYVPSVETVLPVSILYGSLFGKKEGFSFGFSTFFVSNFWVWGLHGPWTPFQCLGAGIAGFLGGFLGVKPSKVRTYLVTAIATLLYEMVMSVYMLMFPFFPMSLILIIITSLPFSITHIVSNLLFATAIPKGSKLLEETLTEAKLLKHPAY